MKEIQNICKEKNCQRVFFISSGEAEHYASKNLLLPKRCKQCRQKQTILRTQNPTTLLAYANLRSKSL